MKSLIIMASLSILMGCNSTKTTVNETTDMEQAKEMIAQGFLMGTIKTYATEGNCPFVIEVVGETPIFYDPINLEEVYKVNDQKIWFKFAGLRRMNRCIKANPISILEIQKRAE
jgi:hypothetical protein